MFTYNRPLRFIFRLYYRVRYYWWPLLTAAFVVGVIIGFAATR